MQYTDTLPIQDYDNLLAEKTARLAELLATFGVSTEQIAVFSSPVSHFRMRAEFGIWHEGDEFNYTVFADNPDASIEPEQRAETDTKPKQKKIRVNVTSFPIACEAINELMPRLKAALKTHPLLNQKLFQVEFLATLSGDMLVTLIYHKKLDDDWVALAKPLEDELGCHLIGRSRGQKLVLSQDFVIEQLSVNGSDSDMNQTFTYKQLEGGFTQPNARVCQHMLSWACAQASTVARADSTDLLELYCGNGNFTLPLSQYFRQTLATEISKTSVNAAKWNIQENGISSIQIARLSAEELTEALSGKRAFRRLQQEGIVLADYDVSTVFVDPPRAGIDDDTLALISQFEHIIYISCNPDTLADNLQTLCKTHLVKSAALFDQFPYTHHIEAGVMLSTR